MKDRQLRKHLCASLRIEPVPSKLDETIRICTDIIRNQAAEREEERTGFWRFLSDVLRFEGVGIFGLQALTLLVVCLGMTTIAEAPKNIPVFMPLFVLAAIPALFKGLSHGMYEIEAVTRASGSQIVLAKLILAGGANLVCMTALLAVEICLYRSAAQIGRLVLYSIVPYLVCMAVVLRCLRLHGKEGLTFSLTGVFASCAAWGICARTIPWLYEISATGIWIIAFLLFAALFLREIRYILQSRKEGNMYGIIA